MKKLIIDISRRLAEFIFIVLIINFLFIKGTYYNFEIFIKSLASAIEVSFLLIILPFTISTIISILISKKYWKSTSWFKKDLFFWLIIFIFLAIEIFIIYMRTGLQV